MPNPACPKWPNSQHQKMQRDQGNTGRTDSGASSQAGLAEFTGEWGIRGSGLGKQFCSLQEISFIYELLTRRQRYWPKHVPLNSALTTDLTFTRGAISPAGRSK